MKQQINHYFITEMMRTTEGDASIKLEMVGDNVNSLFFTKHNDISRAISVFSNISELKWFYSLLGKVLGQLDE